MGTLMETKCHVKIASRCRISASQHMSKLDCVSIGDSLDLFCSF